VYHPALRATAAVVIFMISSGNASSGNSQNS
jgi:hypothetical protein